MTPALATLRQLAADMATLKELCADPTPATLDRWHNAIVAALKEEDGRWLTEERAARRSGHQVNWLRRRFAAWERLGMARLDGHRRYYHEAVIERRDLEPPADDARAQARRDAKP